MLKKIKENGKVFGKEILSIAVVALVMGVFTMLSWNLGIAKAIDGVNSISLGESVMVLTLFNTIKVTVEMFSRVPKVIK
mgnify:FL=1|jgi:hypothetical protein|tara:strand:+ start:302 stop:538 length:237 start_codon:yes stop_codon:yes gene_type:complete